MCENASNSRHAAATRLTLARATASLRQMADPIALLAQANQNPMVTALNQYLRNRNAQPVMQFARTEDGSEGQFSYGDAHPPQGDLTLAPIATAGTVAHELTHAATRQIVNQYYDMVMGKIPKDPQFMEGYEKLSFGGKQTDLASKLAGGFLRDNQDYRMSTTEAPAFANGNMVDKANGAYTWPAPAHVDPTMSTEFQMLLDLANRAAQKVPK